MEDDVGKFVPFFHPRVPYETSRPITLRQLASHTSGLPRENPCAHAILCPVPERSQSGPNCPEDKVMFALMQMYTLEAAWQTPHYSNLGMSLLGRALGYAVNAS